MKKKKNIGSIIVITIILMIMALFCIFPFYWMIISSFKQPTEVMKIPVDIFTFNLSIDSYVKVFEYGDGMIWRAYLNSLLIAAISTIGTLFTSSLAAFAFAKMKFKGNKLFYGLFIATLMIPGQVTMLPLYVLFAQVRLVNTLVPLILPGVMINTYGVFMLRQFIVSIPNELLEAAEVDGCGWFKKYWRIVIPLLKPSLVTLGLFTFIGSWNNYFGQLIYLSGDTYPTIPLLLAGFQDGNMTSAEWGVVMAASTLSIVPIAIVYLKCQKYFVQGIATTGIK